MARPAGSGFSWGEASGAFVATPVQSLIDLGYAPGSPAEPLTLNDGLRQVGLWTQYLAGLSIDIGGGGWALVADELRSRSPAWVDTVSGSRVTLSANVDIESEAGTVTVAAAGVATLFSADNARVWSAAANVELIASGGQTIIGPDAVGGSVDCLTVRDGRRYGYGAGGRTFGVRLIPSVSGRLTATVTDSSPAGIGLEGSGTIVWRVELPTVNPRDGGAAGDLYALPENVYLQAMRGNITGSGTPNPTIAAKLFRVTGSGATELTDSTLTAVALTAVDAVTNVAWAIAVGDRPLSVASDAIDGATRYVVEVTIVGATDRRVDFYGLGFEWTRKEAH